MNDTIYKESYAILVAACKNSSAALFTAAKITHLTLLPQGETEAAKRVVGMVDIMDAEGFGHCSNTAACGIECPQEISVLHITRMKYEYNKAKFFSSKIKG